MKFIFTNRLQWLVLIFTLTFLSNCTSTINISNQNRLTLNQENISRIEGYYSNLAYPDSSHKHTNDSIHYGRYGDVFWEELRPFFRKSHHDFKNSIIRVQLKEKQKIFFTLLIDKKVVSEKKFSYLIKDGSLIVRNNYSLSGIPLIFYRYKFEKLYLGVDNNNYLTMDMKGLQNGGIFFLIFGNELGSSVKYKPVDQ